MNNHKNKPFDMNDYCTIIALEDEVYFSNNTILEYCIDGGEWTILLPSSSSVTINSGQSFSIKARLLNFSIVGGIPNIFTIHGKCGLIGNVMSLLTGDTSKDIKSLEEYGNALSYLFCNCTSIQSVSKDFLPATTLADSCYEFMFSGCTSLTTAPELPATTLAYGCYVNMFSGCTSLTTAPELPATTLAYGCYVNMFKDCTNLTTAPALPATTLADSCYYSMFSGCTSLTTAPELPATTLADSCYHSMFYNCTSLTTAPVLSAKILKYLCYAQMFNSCSKLNYIKMLATDISASNCLSTWVKNVASTGTFIKNVAMTSLPTGENGIPSGWTVQNA